MEEIRVFSEEHVTATADLYLKTVRGQSRRAPRALNDAIREIFLGNPWLSADISSLVYMDKGRLVGFAGVIPRPMEFRGREIQAATITLWMMDREKHRGIGGMKLIQQLFKGTQDFSYGDGAANEASSVFTALGARVSSVSSFNWLRVLRPFQTARGVLDRANGVWHMAKRVSGVMTGPLDFLLSKAPLSMFKPPISGFSSKMASAVELVECIQEIRGREALRPAYSMPSFGWLITQAGTGRGHQALRMKIVYGLDGSRCGSFVYYAREGGIADVLQIGCHRRQQFADVLKALFQDAWEQGAAAVRGQAIPQFLVTLTEQFCVFRQPYACVIGHSRNPEIMNAFQTGDIALSRLDAGSWLPFPADDWT